MGSICCRENYTRGSACILATDNIHIEEIISIRKLSTASQIKERPAINYIQV